MLPGSVALGSQSAHIQKYAFRNLKQQNWTSHLLSSIEATDGRFTLCSCSFKGLSCHGCSQCSAFVRTLCLMVVAYHVPRRCKCGYTAGFAVARSCRCRGAMQTNVKCLLSIPYMVWKNFSKLLGLVKQNRSDPPLSSPELQMSG